MYVMFEIYLNCFNIDLLPYNMSVVHHCANSYLLRIRASIDMHIQFVSTYIHIYMCVCVYVCPVEMNQLFLLTN